MWKWGGDCTHGDMHTLSPGGKPALMIIRFLRTFHLLRSPSNYVWSPSFLPHRMSRRTQFTSLISRAAAWTRARGSGLRAGGGPRTPRAAWPAVLRRSTPGAPEGLGDVVSEDPPPARGPRAQSLPPWSGRGQANRRLSLPHHFLDGYDAMSIF